MKMDVKNKAFVIKKEKTEEFLKFLKEEKEKNKEYKDRWERISKHINKD
jgi:hypothetical protein